jgi:hypothetical protein
MPIAARAPMVPRVPVVSISTTDLWAELDRYCTCEVDCITIECQCERRRNLEGDFSVANPTPATHATRSPSSLGVVGGCMAFAPHLRMMVWPRKFCPRLSEKYDGPVNLTEFLHICTTTILTVGGNEAVMVIYFLVALTGTTQFYPWSPYSLGKSCADSSRPTSRVPTLGPATRPTSMTCSSAQGNHFAPLSSSSPRFVTPSLASPLLLSLLCFDRVMVHTGTRTPVKRLVVAIVARDARCITLGAIAPRSARRLGSLWNSSVSRRTSRSVKMVCHPASGTANKSWIQRRIETKRWSSRMPRGH